MESFGNFFVEECQNLSRMLVDDQDFDQFARHGLMSNEHDHGFNFEIPSIFLPTSNVFSNADSFVVDDESLVYVSNNINPNFYHYLSQCNESFQLCPSNTVPSPSNDVCDQSIDFCMMDNSWQQTQVFSDDVVAKKVKMENSLVRGKETPLKRKLEMVELSDEANNEKNEKNPKKKTRVSKNKKDLQPNKNQKIMDDKEKGSNNNGETNRQSSSSCSSDDDLNGSQETLNSNRKTRASRGTATDPQSLYARKRRERINERLRILQNLVPNGTKVDISTMLEEAVEYVKFLKLQIQLLSSDDMWMYAPIAYNGMDMGLYQSITPTL